MYLQLLSLNIKNEPDYMTLISNKILPTVKLPKGRSIFIYS
jgi:hypothetical protein